jgi:NADH-quinone oxidoreductase subunit C
LKTVEEIMSAIEAAVPGAVVELISNPSPSGQHSLRLAPECALAVAKFLRDDAELALDYLSNVTGVDWPDSLETVYHLYSVEKKHGGHPDLRRLLMWEGFKDHPMRRDYREPDDFEYEPTAHDEVLKRAQAHQAALRGQPEAEAGA